MTDVLYMSFPKSVCTILQIETPKENRVTWPLASLRHIVRHIHGLFRSFPPQDFHRFLNSAPYDLGPDPMLGLEAEG